MTDVDLMDDAFRYDEGPNEAVIHIVKRNGHFTVIQDGRMAEALVFDELLGQIVELCHPTLASGKGRYAMMSREDIAAQETHRAALKAEREQQQ